MDRLRCVVERITYQNDTNGYSVLKCHAKGSPELITVVGSMPEVHVGYCLFLSRHVTLEPEAYFEHSFNNSDYSTFGLRLGFGYYF